MKALLIFTYGVSLEIWYEKGIIIRETSLYEKLSEKKIEYLFLTFGTNKDFQYSNLLGDIKIKPVHNLLNSKISKFHFIKSLLLPLKLKKTFKSVDIIKTNQVQGSWIACIAKILFKKKIIIRGGYEWLRRYTNDTKFHKENLLKYLLKYTWIFLNELISYKIADGIILTNKDDISFITKYFKLKHKYKKNKIRHFYNFVDTDLFKPVDLPKKKKHILFIGNLKSIKNLKNLLISFKEMKELNLDIIGAGPDKLKLEKIVEEFSLNVKFLGVFPNNKIPEIINQYDIFILPSYYEGNPKALLEAMSCGIACIGTNVQGINNIIKHDENGYLCGLTPESIKDAILTLYNDKNLREKIGKNARAFVLNNCSLESIAEKEYNFYQEILKK